MISLALDRNEIDKTIGVLSAQLNEIEWARRSLTQGRRKLNSAWKADETGYMNVIIDSLDRNCARLQQQIEQLQKDIAAAAQEIAEQEAAAAVAARRLSDGKDQN